MTDREYKDLAEKVERIGSAIIRGMIIGTICICIGMFIVAYIYQKIR